MNDSPTRAVEPMTEIARKLSRAAVKLLLREPDPEIPDLGGLLMIAASELEHARTALAAKEKETGPREKLMAAIAGELNHAYRKHGRDPWGRHEWYAILLEEVDELWAEIKADAPQEKVLAEARQIAAMVFRYIETGDRYLGEHPAIPVRLAAASPLGAETKE